MNNQAQLDLFCGYGKKREQRTDSKTCGMLFAGGGGKSMGAIAAGYTPSWEIEIDPAKAQVLHANTHAKVYAAPVEDIDPEYLPGVDLLCASPPCQQYSVARKKHLEVRKDSDVGLEILRYAELVGPRHILIENVRGYMDSFVFAQIVAGLQAYDYKVEYGIYDAADFGVPQFRKRLVCRATMAEGFYPLIKTQEQVSWDSVLTELLGNFIDNPWVDWQRRKLPATLKKSILAPGGNSSFAYKVTGLPSYTQTCSVAVRPQRIWLHPCPGEDASPAEGTVVQLSTRGIARICSFPDTYNLPISDHLSGEILGNSFPPLMAQRFIETFMDTD